MKKTHLAAFLVAASIFLTIPIATLAQNEPAPQVSMVALKVVRNESGAQSVITPKGDLAPLPGAGVKGDIAEIYMGSQGGFWYQDRNGDSVDLDAAVQALQARRAARASAQQIPQYAPQPYYEQQAPVQNTQYTQNTTTQSSSNGVMTAVGTAAAAGMGAMAGAAMSNNYYNAPYGTPMHYGLNGCPYYYNNKNERKQFSDLNQNQQVALYNKRKQTVNNQQAAVQHMQTSQQNRQEQNQANQSNRTQMAQEAQASRGGAQSYQHQQQWYQEQLSQNPSRFKKSESNPFAAQQDNRRAARGNGGGDRGGRSISRGGGRARRR